MPRRSTAPPAPAETIVLYFALEHIEPEIWRVVRVPAELSLPGLHAVIQAVMGWQDYHLHLFRVAGALYGTETDEPFEGYQGSGREVSVVEALARGGGSIGYEYDFGDDWQVRITRAEGKWSGHGPPVLECLDGDLAGPKEDSGGPHGYSEILAATMLGKGRLHREIREWLGPGFDPRRFDRLEVNLALVGMMAPPKRRAVRRRRG